MGGHEMINMLRVQMFLNSNKGISKISLLQEMLRMKEITKNEFNFLLWLNKLRPWD